MRDQARNGPAGSEGRFGPSGSHALYANGAQPLWRLFNLELDFFALAKVFIGYLTVMNKDIFLSFVRLDESVPFRRAKPLNFPAAHRLT